CDPQAPHRVIYKLRELLGVDEMGGTMRLGAWPCKLEPGSFAAKAYGKLEISERHRHRYVFNRDYEKTLTAAGLRITGRTPDHSRVAASRTKLRRAHRRHRPALVPRLPVPPRIQSQAAGTASAVRRLHWCRPGTQKSSLAPGHRKSPPASGRRRPPRHRLDRG